MAPGFIARVHGISVRNNISSINLMYIFFYHKYFKNRPEGGINHEKAPFAKTCNPLKNLSEIIDFVKPTALIG
jgi:hypothetical protein